MRAAQLKPSIEIPVTGAQNRKPFRTLFPIRLAAKNKKKQIAVSNQNCHEKKLPERSPSPWPLNYLLEKGLQKRP